MAGLLPKTPTSPKRELAKPVATQDMAASDAQSTPLELPPWRISLLMLSISAGLFLSFLDTSIVATSLFAIGNEFNDLGKVNWVALSYTLSYLGCAVLLARLSDVIGRHHAFVVSFCVFIAFSLGCGFAPTMDHLIAFRTLQGIGGSGLYSIAMIMMPEIAPSRLRPMLGGLIGVIITFSSVLGPVLGGLLTQVDWRWIFWINGPIGVVAVGLFHLTWPKPQYLPAFERRSWAEVDYLGSILLIAAAVLVVFPFQSAGETTDQWSRPVFLAPLTIGGACWSGLIAWSYFIEKRWGDAMGAAIPIRLLRNRVYASAVLNTMFLGFPYILTVYAFPLRLQVVNGKSPLVAGIMLLPMLGSSALGSVIAGKLNGQKDRVFGTLLVATSSMVLGCGLLSTLSSSQNLQPKALGFLVFVGLGFGLSVATATIMAVLHSSVRDHATAQGIVAQSRVLGGSIGIAASSAILGILLQERMGDYVQPQQMSPGSTGLPETQMETVRRAYSDAFNKDMRVCTIVSGAAILLAFGTFSRAQATVPEEIEQEMREDAQERQCSHKGLTAQQTVPQTDK
ncbi:major facilitator superfamily transporter [Xylariomycetidae sp. FL0641]|nr:major facilitator superfamily transporter [Xylariomycetidae sp. FL0641]